MPTVCSFANEFCRLVSIDHPKSREQEAKEKEKSKQFGYPADERQMSSLKQLGRRSVKHYRHASMD